MPTSNHANHRKAMADVRRVLGTFDTLAGRALTPADHIAAIERQVAVLKASLSDGLDDPPERFRLARVAAHAVAVMSETDDAD